MTLLDDISQATAKVKGWLAGRKPQLAIVLGSGLGAISEQLQDADHLNYVDIPNFAASGVSGHAGCLHCGKIFGRLVLLFQGRYHFYEGYSAWQVTAPVRLAAELGCKQLLLTNAAGGIADQMQAGDFMLVSDHINLTGQNPLIGRPEREFVDLSNLYAQDFYFDLNRELQQQAIRLHSGVLAWMLGPNYETPAEINMLQALGASAVSMSTIPEAIVAKRYQLDVAAISYISNLAAGKTDNLDHQDVLASGKNAAQQMEKLLAALFDFWSV
ncbi:purine-nucleoside phosphorylase [Malonomonas rubra]|nr:purine-nucleoside phosphorylase [Malonomonas rubra]